MPLTVPHKNGAIALWPTRNGSIPYILALAGSESIFNEITEYKFSSLMSNRAELQYEKRLYQWLTLLYSSDVCET